MSGFLWGALLSLSFVLGNLYGQHKDDACEKTLDIQSEQQDDQIKNARDEVEQLL